MTSEAEGPPQEEPDTPENQVSATFPELVTMAGLLAEKRRQLDGSEAAYERVKKELLEMWEQMPSLHGIRLVNGDAVRRTWSTSAGKAISPTKLREVMADAPEFIVEVVDAKRLKEAYPTIHARLAEPKSKRTLTVRLIKEKEAPTERGG